MADVSNLNINERSNVEQPNLRGNENWENKISKLIYFKRQVWDSVKLRLVRRSNWQTIKRFADLSNFDKFRNWQNSENMLIFQFGKSKKFPIWKIPKIFHLEYSKNSYNWLIWEFIEFFKLFKVVCKKIDLW